MNARKNKFFGDRATVSSVIQVKIDDIRPNRAQPRFDFDTNSIIRLADSIRRYGILQPLSVRRLNDEGYSYELIAGERRLRAARSLGYSCVPCIVIEADEKMSAELAIIENLLREDLNMFEEAYGFRQLIDTYSMTQEEIARKVSLSQSAVANKVRLLRLSYEEQQKIVEYNLTERHARALLKIPEAAVRLAVIEVIHKRSMNVSAAEEYIERALSEPAGAQNSTKSKESPLVCVYGAEKAANDVLGAINKKLEALKRLGNEAEVDIVNTEKAVELHIKFIKEAM